MMDWSIVSLFGAPAVAMAGAGWGMIAMIHADEARSNRKNTSTDA